MSDFMSTECSVFKEFLVRKRQINDTVYLSVLTLNIISGADAIILNSVVNVNKAVPYLKGYTTINCYLDNDNARQTILAGLTGIYASTVINGSALYPSSTT